MLRSPLDAIVDPDQSASIAAPRILVVEASVRRSVARALQAQGYAVTGVESGEAALAAVDGAAQPFDLVISDVVMRGMSGVALAERLHLRHEDVRVILISGYPAEHFPDETFSSGNIELLEKPFTPAQLTARVRERIQRGARR